MEKLLYTNIIVNRNDHIYEKVAFNKCQIEYLKRGDNSSESIICVNGKEYTILTPFNDLKIEMNN